jgi:hypothetical protein
MENQVENQLHSSVGRAQHRLGTELSLIFACCHKLRQMSDSVLSHDQLILLQRIEKSAEAIRDLRPELTAAADAF